MTSPLQHTVVVTPEQANERLDKALTALLPALSRSRIQSLIALGQVALSTPRGSAPVHDGDAKVRAGQIYTIIIPEVEPTTLLAQDIALDIIYEDAHFLIVNKPAGMVAHPAPGNPDSTLVNALLSHCGESLSGIGGVARPGLVHRIDKDTSGLLAVAKHDAAYQNLSAQLVARTLKRTYLAVARGVPVPHKGTITGNVGRHPRNRQKMAVVHKGGKHAVTHYNVLERFGDRASFVECQLDTGRTHQIRVHFQHIGHPLVGDQTYGGKTPGIVFPRQALHAWRLALNHPDTGAPMQFEAPLPGDMEALIKSLRSHA